MTKLMAFHRTGAYKRGQAVREALKLAASKVGGVAKGGVNAVKSGGAAVRDFSRGVVGK